MLNYHQTAKAIAIAIDRDPIMAMTIKQHVSEKRMLECLDLKTVDDLQHMNGILRGALERANRRTILEHIKHVWINRTRNVSRKQNA